MKKIIITGATSGIGRALAVEMIRRGYKVGATGRRIERLSELKKELGDHLYIKQMDVALEEASQRQLTELIEEMSGMDIIVLNAGVGRDKEFPQWDSDKRIIEVNVMAFARQCHFAFNYFMKQGHGQIVGMSSIASHLASSRAAAYTASKHFISNYMTGFRQKANHTDANITVTDIKPGFVESEMTRGMKGMFWVAPVQKAVKQMADAIEKKKNHAYITKRWRLVAWLASLTPQFVWDRL